VVASVEISDEQEKYHIHPLVRKA